MKTKNFKIVMGPLAILFSIYSSFLSHATENETMAPITCYISPIGLSPCAIPVMCSNVGGPRCTASYQGQIYLAFAKINPTDTTCPSASCYQWPE